MKVPFSWLKQYVDIDVTAQELEDKLFGCGFEVEERIDLGGEISKVVVGVVTECVPQEGTHLHICKVDCGEYGHDIQISTVLFFRDPLKAENGSSEQNLLRLCDMHSVPISTNIATAEVLLRGLDQGDLDYREGIHPDIVEPLPVHRAVC